MVTLASTNLVNTKPRQDSVPALTESIAGVSIAAARPRQDTLPAFTAYTFTIPLVNTQPRQDATPKLFTPVLCLNTGAAGLGTPTLTQNKRSLTAATLATQPAGMPLALFNILVASSSITNSYSTISPLLDSPLPNITLASAFNFPIGSDLAAGAAAFDAPTIGQVNTLGTPANIASAAAGIDQPQFVQFQAFTAVNIASAAAGIKTAEYGDIYELLTPQLNFASVDSLIKQTNAALTGLSPSVSFGIVGNVASLIQLTSATATGISAAMGIAIANKAAMVNAAALVISESQYQTNNATLSSSINFKGGAATFIFDTETLSPSTSFGSYIGQVKNSDIGMAIASILSVHEGMRLPIAPVNLSVGASMFADIVTPTSIVWNGSALFAPSTSLTAALSRNIPGISASLNTLSSLVSDAQLDIFGNSFGLSSVLQAALSATLAATATATQSALLSVTEQALVTAKSPLGVSAVLLGILSQARPTNSGFSIQSTVVPFANLIEQSNAALAAGSSSVSAKEIQSLALNAGLIPSPVFGINIHSMLYPIVSWSNSALLTINERVLPGGTAFYFISPALTSSSIQTMIAKSSAALQAAMLSHEGLLLQQVPTAIHATSLMSSNEKFLIGPNLTLVSDILLHPPHTIGLEATQADLDGETNISVDYTIAQFFAAQVAGYSTLLALPSSAVSGKITVSMGCYFNIDIMQQRTVEQGPLIVATRSNINRIVAQGDLIVLTE